MSRPKKPQPADSDPSRLVEVTGAEMARILQQMTVGTSGSGEGIQIVGGVRPPPKPVEEKKPKP